MRIQFALFTALAACSGTSSATFDPLFNAPMTTATPGSVQGLWAGTKDVGGARLDLRFKFEKDATTIATKCTYKDGTVLTAGVIVASRSAESTEKCHGFVGSELSQKCGTIDILETKSDRQGSGEKTCMVNARPVSSTFDISKTNMRYELAGDLLDLVKISD